MADNLTKEQRSHIMSTIRSKDTRPEMIVRRYLFSQGFRYRVHQKNLPGKPDIVLKRYKAVIIINGCFWHGHEPCKIFKMPKTRVEFWTQKINRNKERDYEVIRLLNEQGWRVYIIWECQLDKTKVESTLGEIAKSITAP